jgi:hypothetical protein
VQHWTWFGERCDINGFHGPAGEFEIVGLGDIVGEVDVDGVTDMVGVTDIVGVADMVGELLNEVDTDIDGEVEMLGETDAEGELVAVIVGVCEIVGVGETETDGSGLVARGAYTSVVVVDVMAMARQAINTNTKDPKCMLALCSHCNKI